MKTPTDMAVTAFKNAIDKNPLLHKLDKLSFNHGVKQSFHFVKEVVVISTDQKSLNNSKQFLTFLENAVKHLPKDDLQGLDKANSFAKVLTQTKTNLSKLVNFAVQYDIDDSDTKKLLANVQKSITIMNDMIDYMNFAIKTQSAIDSLKSSPKLSAEELKAKIAA